ncbi:hypothetical protein J5N97_013664 [Dioscorea zingiberensis]|uniref:Uncharacterized protein n=1 Tax=Dioscorea zingiberensis TaxID=325984 RepID=A0A9D5CTQ6_9LILI|nr:hypothetical protein J5N97_013664 [Dioscorea zingiberensis]
MDIVPLINIEPATTISDIDILCILDKDAQATDSLDYNSISSFNDYTEGRGTTFLVLGHGMQTNHSWHNLGLP